MTRTDYCATNHIGTVVRTFDTLEAACIWVANHHPEHVGLSVEEVTTTITRRRIFRPAVPLRIVA